ncbi:hypothetical protein RhiirA1_472385 [Rhizophagus irregularis]|uniref:Uncharacterized protein n=1 Tax=Rhizophagus irregularis TaxID=588596 RepID=A0A2N0R2H8_9GLOM|nr:hypothetical protein RhiirA1_472385 [Rhizophagus irregularis]
MANNFTRTIVNFPKIQSKDLSSFSYKNKDTNEFNNNNKRNLSDSIIVLDSENNQIKGNNYPAETGPVSYKINWVQD